MVIQQISAEHTLTYYVEPDTRDTRKNEKLKTWSPMRILRE